MQTYAWDPKAQSRGEDKPLKVNDHCPDMWRAAILGTRSLTTTFNDTVEAKKYNYNMNSILKRREADEETTFL